MEKIIRIFKAVLVLVGLFINLLPKACEIVLRSWKKVLEFVNVFIKPISDRTKNNVDNKIQAKLSEMITESIENIEEVIIPKVGKIETFFNKYLGN